jgi:outer membrane protein TolC
MSVLRKGSVLAALACAVLGCRGTGTRREPVPALASTTPAPAPTPSKSLPPDVVPASFQEPLAPPTPTRVIESEAFPSQPDTLSREWLAAEVEARNPSLAAMVAAWQAAAQRYPQVVALDDPMLMGMIAPESAGSDITETAYALQLNQKLPWFGKRALRGESAAAEADAAAEEADDSRLAVRLAADLAFLDYYLAARLIELNNQNTTLMEQFRDTARVRFQTGDVTQQDVLQADLELADLARRQLEVARMQRVAVARINTLLRRWPDAALPPPPATLETPPQAADTELLWQTALSRRPDLAALAWRVQSEEAALDLAYKNFYPDFDVFARYDTFWQPSSTQGPLRAQLGATMNVPVWREKLHAAVCEAQFRLNQRRAEFDQRALDIQYEVVSAARQVEESRNTVELFIQRLLPAADQNVAAARANYENRLGGATFLDLAQAQRQLVSIRERQLEAIVAHHRRLAELDRAVGVRALATAN